MSEASPFPISDSSGPYSTEDIHHILGLIPLAAKVVTHEVYASVTVGKPHEPAVEEGKERFDSVVEEVCRRLDEYYGNRPTAQPPE